MPDGKFVLVLYETLLPAPTFNIDANHDSQHGRLLISLLKDFKQANNPTGAGNQMRTAGQPRDT